MKDIKLSIIIPHYNSPKKLERLLKSIPFKEYLEVIIIDDKSNKDLKKYEELKNNKKFMNTKFLNNNSSKKGAGVARNLGLEVAKGEWILFADADDYFTQNAFSIIDKYLNSEEDVIYFTPTSIIENKNTESNRHLYYSKLISNYLNNNKNSELFLRFYFRSPCSKLIKKKLILENNIKFSETIVCNDDYFSVKTGLLAKKINASKEIIYCITESEETLSKKKGKQAFMNCFKESINVDLFARKNLLKKEYKKVKLYSLHLLYHSKKKYDISVFTLIEAFFISLKFNISIISIKKIIEKLLGDNNHNHAEEEFDKEV